MFLDLVKTLKDSHVRPTPHLDCADGSTSSATTNDVVSPDVLGRINRLIADKGQNVDELDSSTQSPSSRMRPALDVPLYIKEPGAVWGEMVFPPIPLLKRKNPTKDTENNDDWFATPPNNRKEERTTFGLDTDLKPLSWEQLHRPFTVKELLGERLEAIDLEQTGDHSPESIVRRVKSQSRASITPDIDMEEAVTAQAEAAEIRRSLLIRLCNDLCDTEDTTGEYIEAIKRGNLEGEEVTDLYAQTQNLFENLKDQARNVIKALSSRSLENVVFNLEHFLMQDTLRAEIDGLTDPGDRHRAIQIFLQRVHIVLHMCVEYMAARLDVNVPEPAQEQTDFDTVGTALSSLQQNIAPLKRIADKYLEGNEAAITIEEKSDLQEKTRKILEQADKFFALEKKHVVLIPSQIQSLSDDYTKVKEALAVLSETASMGNLCKAVAALDHTLQFVNTSVAVNRIQVTASRRGADLQNSPQW
jgi:hypothetical protein